MRVSLGYLLISALAFTSACQSKKPGNSAQAIKVDGSSTVYPITEAVAEEYRKVSPKTPVTIGVSGTGGGFKKFVQSELDITNASRKIKPEEVAKAAKANITYSEIPVAYDGISVIVHPQNDWVDHLTVAELKKIWEPESKVVTWKDVRSSWPDRPIKLYGPGTDSGTFDYFTEAINGKSHVARSEFTKSEDDNVLVQGVAGDKDSLGFFGYAYYKANQKRLRAIPIDGGRGPIMPSETTINDQSYSPLSRVVYIYVNNAALKRPEVADFLKFYLDRVGGIATQVGYIPLPTTQYQALRDTIKQTTDGPNQKAIN